MKYSHNDGEKRQPGPSAPCPTDTLAVCADCVRRPNCPSGLRDQSPHVTVSLS